MPAFQGPIHIDPDAAARAAVRIAGEVRCTCRTPFCRGQDSADWLTCERSCRACRPRPFQPPTRTAAGLEAPTIEGTSGGVDDG